MGTSPPGAPRQLRKALAGDLDTLVLTAMRKEPERRFPSVDQFAEDIRRHLDGRPIRSRPDTWAYRTSKFLRRHAWGVAATATISILVVGFAVSMAVQRARIANQAEQLAVERDRSESVLDFVLDFLRVSDPKTGGGETLTVREALDSAMVGLDVRLQDDPQTRAALLDTVGSVYRNLALYGLAQRPLEEALELRINALGEDHPEVGESLLNLASLERHLGHDGEASRHLIRAVDVLRSVYPSGHADLATALNNLAALRRSDGKLDVAEDLYREALSMQGTLLGEMHSDTAVTLNNLAVLLTAKGSLEEAETLYRRSVHIRAEVDGPDSLAYATGLNSLGAFLVRTGEAGAAAKLHREALTIRRRRHRGDHPQVATSLHNLADALRRSGQAAEAVEPIEEALAMQLRLTGPEHRRVEKLRAMEERIREAVAAEAASKESVGREEPTGTQVPDGD
ncbi:MAG: tetratricopeptide repeat protein [Acidobacteriota bacterium]